MVVIDDCTPAASQRWSRDRENHTVTNVASGLVLDLTEGRTTDGTTVQLSVLPLDDQGTPIPTSSQKWAWSVP
jgi:ricin-type beta-trefoil lectin protein